MNKEGLEALLSIAKKQGWNGKPATEVIALLQFSEYMGINVLDNDDLFFITSSSEGIQYQLDTEEEEEDMIEELAWYNHARMMGWE